MHKLYAYGSLAGGIVGLGYLIAAYRAWYAADKQARQPRLIEGQGGIYQRMNELRWRNHARNRAWVAVILMALTLIIYLNSGR